MLSSIQFTFSATPSETLDGGPAVSCDPLRLLVRPHLVCLSDVEESAQVMTGARCECHFLPPARNRMIVSGCVRLVHSADQVFGTLDRAENTVGARGDPDT